MEQTPAMKVAALLLHVKPYFTHVFAYDWFVDDMYNVLIEAEKDLSYADFREAAGLEVWGD